MFDTLTDKLGSVFAKITSRGVLSEKDIDEAMREIRIALLEADVSLPVIKEFIAKVKEQAIGEKVVRSIQPGQMVIKIVHEELVKILGADDSKLNFNTVPPAVVLMVGLQGAGKTTMSGKLALQLRKNHNKRPLLVACDIYRPAAIKQLEIVGKQIDVPVFQMGDKVSPVEIAKEGIKYARENSLNVVIIDTAGRLHIDEELMTELKDVKVAVDPNEILLVVDSMTGQDAVNVAETFNEALDISGVVLTKLDGDTRGGAALSIREMIQKPIKFIGVGEKMNDFEVFHPDRMASRILGMGDVLSLIEKAQEAIDEKEATELSQKMLENDFTYDDYLTALEQMKKLGPLNKIMEMIPGMPKEIKDIDFAAGEKELAKVKAIIQSMTAKERKNPKLIVGSSSRKKRIAQGSGTSLQAVNKLIKGHEMMRKQMKQFKSLTKKPGKKGLFGKLPF